MKRSTATTSAGAKARTTTHAQGPASVGEWELVKLVAEGPHSSVYQARPLGSPRSRPASYAVKILNDSWNDNAYVLRQFVREAYVGRKVRHPNLVSVLSAQTDETPRYLAMPWLQGLTLDRVIAMGGPLAAPRALWTCRQIAQALEALHAAGWTHRDIKPANIHISPTGHATLLDLGFVQPVEEESSIVNRPIAGAPHYIAPEMITSTLRADIRSDIYSLGVVLFEAIAGRRPFEGDDLATLAAAHRQAEPPLLDEFQPDLPQNLVRLVRRMIAKEPLRRPQTPTELVELLSALEIETFALR